MTAIYLTLHPHGHALSVDVITQAYQLPDLCGTLADYFSSASYAEQSRRRSPVDSVLPITTFHVWKNLQIQHHSFQDSCIISPHQRVQALPPTKDLPFGQCNTVLALADNGD